MSQYILVISDIHGNLPALKSVLARALPVSREIWVLGDTAGYGPEPEACLKLLRQHNTLMVPGNHDWAVCGKLSLSRFNTEAAAAITIHKKRLSNEQKDFLAALPPSIIRHSVHISHGHPANPLWGYVLDTPAAAGVLARAETSLTLLGHSHITALWTYDAYRGARRLPTPLGKPISYAGTPHLANPGSVGQSRDGNPAARYMFLDPDRKIMEFHCCPWRSGPLRRKMIRDGYPPGLIERMTCGH